MDEMKKHIQKKGGGSTLSAGKLQMPAGNEPEWNKKPTWQQQDHCETKCLTPHTPPRQRWPNFAGWPEKDANFIDSAIEWVTRAGNLKKYVSQWEKNQSN